MQSMIGTAGFAINEQMLRKIAQWLWCNVYWTDEKEGEYVEMHKGSDWIQQLELRPETPPFPEEAEAFIAIAMIIGRIEQAWGRSFYDVARVMYPQSFQVNSNSAIQAAMPDLIYRTIMACIGHGIGPDDEEDFPSDLYPAPIYAEDPFMEWQE